jgi:hypothetical protein
MSIRSSKTLWIFAFENETERLHEYPQPNLLNYNKFIGDIGAYIEPDLCLFLYIIYYTLYIIYIDYRHRF